MIIRHAEKPISGDAHGVTPDGDHDRDSLTVSGWVRAGALIELFASASRPPQVGLGSPERIYAAGFRGDQSKRAIQTVTPLADHLGIEVDTRYQQGDEAHLAKKMRELRCTTLVCWHHETIHKIVEHLGTVTPQPPPIWPDDRFDLVWTFTNTADGWTFAQVPQLIMPGDLPDPITEAASVAQAGSNARER
jgi:hypothetical protein